MRDCVELWERPRAERMYMIAGWRQWADAGAVSSDLPRYLIDLTGARKIGEIKPEGFYLFQIPGTHHLLRPQVKLSEGYRLEIERRGNEFYYAGDEQTGLVFFLGDEPHQDEGRYAEAFLDVVEELGVSRVVVMAGVYGAMPYDKDREVSCVYSLPRMKEELLKYAAKLSDYEGGATIGVYLVDQAEHRDIECVAFYAFVPAYDFGHPSIRFAGIKIDTDYKAWYDLMRRLNHMFRAGLDLSNLERQSEELIASMDAKMSELEEAMPDLKVREYLNDVAARFNEVRFMPLSDMWERELGDLFDRPE